MCIFNPKPPSVPAPPPPTAAPPPPVTTTPTTPTTVRARGQQSEARMRGRTGTSGLSIPLSIGGGKPSGKVNLNIGK